MRKLKELLKTIILGTAISLFVIAVQNYLLANKVTSNLDTIQINEVPNEIVVKKDATQTKQNEAIQNSNESSLAQQNSIINTEKNNSNTMPSTVFFYNQLDDTAKIFYNKIKENKEQLQKGNFVFDYGTEFNKLLHTSTGKEKLSAAFQSAWDAFIYDQVDVFYIDITKVNLIRESVTKGDVTTYYVRIEPTKNETYLTDEFSTTKKIQTAKERLQHIANQVIEQTVQDSDWKKVKRIHNWLISNVEYDEEETNENRYNICGALFDGKAVCEGYARALKYLLEQVGVPCLLIAGIGTNSDGITESHAWNYVQLNNKWYAIDATWDDPVLVGNAIVTEKVRNKYFLRGSNSFMQSHVEKGKFTESGMTFQFPKLSITDYEDD